MRIVGVNFTGVAAVRDGVIIDADTLKADLSLTLCSFTLCGLLGLRL